MNPLRVATHLCRKHSAFVIFIALEVAVTIALFANVAQVSQYLLAPIRCIGSESGSRVILVDKLLNFSTWDGAELVAIRNALRHVPGVKDVSLGLGLPFSSAYVLRATLHSKFGAVSAYGYEGDNLLDALGIHVEDGSDFKPGDVMPGMKQTVDAHSIIISHGLAERLFPNVNAVGKWVYWGGAKASHRYIVEGIAKLSVPHPVVNEPNNNAFILPGDAVGSPLVQAVVRFNNDYSIKEKEKEIYRKLISLRFKAFDYAKPVVRSYRDARASYFHDIKGILVVLLSIVVVAVLVVYFGISGVSTLWVRGRRKEIGIRRCLGGTEWDVVKMFSGELLSVQFLGVVIGCLASYYLNYIMRRSLQMGPLPVSDFVYGSLLAITFGQISCLVSCIRYIRVPPLEALRS